MITQTDIHEDLSSYWEMRGSKTPHCSLIVWVTLLCSVRICWAHAVDRTAESTHSCISSQHGLCHAIYLISFTNMGISLPIYGTYMWLTELHTATSCRRQNDKWGRCKKEGSFSENHLVLLSTANISRHYHNRKIFPKYIGPYKITRLVNDVACDIALPPHSKIHNVFHVNLLKEYDGRRAPTSTPVSKVLEEGAEPDMKWREHCVTERRGWEIPLSKKKFLWAG